MPRWGRRRLGTRVMSRSKSVIEPASGRSSPVIRLNSVVLPAPLGPMMRRRSPGATLRLTAAVTRRPPNDFSRLRTASAVIVGVPVLSGAASKMSTGARPRHECKTNAYDGGRIDSGRRALYISYAYRGSSGSQLEDVSAWEGFMQLTRRDLLRWGIVLGGGAALSSGRRVLQAANLPSESPPTRPFVVELTRANGGI